MYKLAEYIIAHKPQPVLTQQVEEGFAQQAAAGLLAAGLAFGPMATPADAAHHHKHHGLAHKQYSEQDIVNAIIGEASGEGYEGMLAVAHVIHNRATDPYYKNDVLHGVYGKHAAHIKTEPQAVKDTALKAWKDVTTTPDPTNGAILWGNANDVQIFKTQAWFKNVEQVAKIGGHYFFKKRK